MELPRRDFLALSAAGATAAAGLTASPAAAAPTSAATGGGASGTEATATQQLALSGADVDHPVEWDFMVTAGRNANVWSTIPVPSHWDFHDFGTYTGGWTFVPEERGLYKHTFTAPARWSGRRTYIVFEGAMTDTTVTVNGRQAGPTHQGGFYRFRYDVTELLRYGAENLLEVTVLRDSTDDSINRAERQGDYWNFGGIYRPVYLQSYPAQHIDRVALDARADGSLTVDAFLGGVTTADRVEAQVTTLDGRPVGPRLSAAVGAGVDSVRLSGRVPGVRQWSAETPHLYRVQVRLLAGGRQVHHSRERFGFRTIEVRPNDGIYVNGRKERFKGANRHIIWPDTGRAVTPEIDRLDIVLMKQMNMNAVRMSHYPPDVSFLDLCDELGLYVLDELAGWQKPYSEAAAVPLVKSMVTRDVNHPSVVLWLNGNEGGHQFAVDDDYALYDPQKRTVIHALNWEAEFNGIKTHHYLNYPRTVAEVANPTIFLPTEFLHALYDGGAGAGLDDYWNVMGQASRCAGGFIWALIDEGIRRDDRGGVIDVNPNYYPDGILGPYREKEASFYTIKDIWSPIQLTDRAGLEASFPHAFRGTVPITNHHTFTNTRQCRFSWKLVTFHSPSDGRTGHRVTARADIASPDLAPGASGVLRLRLPTGWRRADALILTVRNPSGAVMTSWTWTIATPAEHARRIVRPAPRTARTSASEDANAITLRAGATRVTIDKATGLLSAVQAGRTAVSLRNGPAPAVGTATLTDLTSAADGSAYTVTARYTGGLDTVVWRLHASGWLQLDYTYHLTGAHEFFGVTFDYPEAQVRGMTWLGDGPYRVYKNRRRGIPTDVYTKEYNDTATGAEVWKYPEFKGYHARVHWARLRTAEAPITVVTADEDLFLRLFTPSYGWDPRNTQVPVPAGDISFLDAIPAVGTKFDPAANTGPQGQPNQATGDYRRTLYFRFGS